MLTEEKLFESPEEFWAALAPEHLTSGLPSPLLFRGHADETWDLVPTLFRSPDKLPWFGIDPNYAGAAVLGEMALLKNFAEYLDASGLVIPGDCEDMRRSLDQGSLESHLDRRENGRLPFPPPSLLPLMALAQHHGLSTRLLDWTRRSYAAVYFAAVGALECEINKKPKPARLAVWTLDTTLLTLMTTSKSSTSPEAITGMSLLKLVCSRC